MQTGKWILGALLVAEGAHPDEVELRRPAGVEPFLGKRHRLLEQANRPALNVEATLARQDVRIGTSGFGRDRDTHRITLGLRCTDIGSRRLDPATDSAEKVDLVRYVEPGRERPVRILVGRTIQSRRTAILRAGPDVGLRQAIARRSAK